MKVNNILAGLCIVISAQIGLILALYKVGGAYANAVGWGVFLLGCIAAGILHKAWYDEEPKSPKNEHGNVEKPTPFV
jgi:hypothetical protein